MLFVERRRCLIRFRCGNGRTENDPLATNRPDEHLVGNARISRLFETRSEVARLFSVLGKTTA
jgi:hypothetical protein